MRSGTSEWDPGDSAPPPIPTPKSASLDRVCKPKMLTNLQHEKLKLPNQVLMACKSLNKRLTDKSIGQIFVIVNWQLN